MSETSYNAYRDEPSTPGATATIIVSSYTSKCSHCGRGTLVRGQTAHETISGHGDSHGQPGCGATFTAITTDQLGFTNGPIDAVLSAMRPDLPIVPYSQRNAPPPLDTASAACGPPAHRTGHPDCRDCHGGSNWWHPGGEAELCERCRSCCECTCGEPKAPYVRFTVGGFVCADCAMFLPVGCENCRHHYASHERGPCAVSVARELPGGTRYGRCGCDTFAPSTLEQLEERLERDRLEIERIAAGGGENG